MFKWALTFAFTPNGSSNHSVGEEHKSLLSEVSFYDERLSLSRAENV